jgi:hypothetical protein
VFTLRFTVIDVDADNVATRRTSHLNLVDLAGSESAKYTSLSNNYNYMNDAMNGNGHGSGGGGGFGVKGGGVAAVDMASGSGAAADAARAREREARCINKSLSGRSIRSTCF